MYSGGMQKVSIDRHDDHTVSIKLGEYKLLDIVLDLDGKIAIHKRKREKPIAVDARELINALDNIMAS